MFARSAVLGVVIATAIFTQTSQAQYTLAEDVSRMAQWSDAIGDIHDSRPITYQPLGTQMELKHQDIANIIQWHLEPYVYSSPDYVGYMCIYLRQYAKDLRDQAFTLYYNGGFQNRYAAYYTWVYAQSIMQVSNTIAETY